MGQLGGDWRFLLAEMPKGATVKPPFRGDRPRQKLALLASEDYKKGALPLSAIGFANFAYPQKIEDSVGFSKSFVFLILPAKLAKRVLL